MRQLLCILIYLPLIFSSCKKEDNGPKSGEFLNMTSNNTSGSILGTWEIANITTKSTSGYLIGNTEVVTDTDEDSEDYPNDDGFSVTWTFKSDGSLEETLYEDNDIEQYDYTYVKNGNNLFFINQDYGFQIQVTITTLSNNTLIFENSWYSDDTWNDTTYFNSSKDIYTWGKSKKKINSSIQSKNKTAKTPFLKQFIDRKKR